MKKLLGLILAASMLAASTVSLAAGVGDAYLETESYLATKVITDEKFDTDLCGWTKRAPENDVKYSSDAGSDGKAGYMKVNTSGALSINKTYTFGAENVGKKYRFSCDIRSSAASGDLFIYHNKNANSWVKPYIYGANNWIHYDFLFTVNAASQLFVIYTDKTLYVDIDNIKMEYVEPSLSNLSAGTYNVPSKVWQNSESAVSGKVITALYGGDDELISLNSSDFTTSGTKGTAVDVTTTVTIPAGLSGDAYVKNYLWDGYSNIMAYCKSNKNYEYMNLHNGDFEILPKEGSTAFSEGWGARNTVPVELSTDAHSGKYCAKFPGSSTGIQNTMGFRHAFGTVNLCTTNAIVKFWAKTEGTNQYPKLAVYYAATGNASIGTTATIGTEWTEYTMTVPLNACQGTTVNHLFFYPAGDGNNANTTYYVDDVRIIRN